MIKKFRSVSLFFALFFFFISPVNADANLDDIIERAHFGEAQAQFELGMAFLGHKKILAYDSISGVHWLEEAAMRGSIGAQINLGSFHMDGVIVRKSYETAFKWYKLAAEKGTPVAQIYLSNLYSKGMGTDQDKMTAYALTLTALKNLAQSENSNQKSLIQQAKDMKIDLEQDLSLDQKAEAKTLSEKFNEFYKP